MTQPLWESPLVNFYSPLGKFSTDRNVGRHISSKSANESLGDA